MRIEDVSWESLDGERGLAFVVRPIDAPAPLPAVVCLHGGSGSRDSLVAPSFGLGAWTRPGRDQPHERLLGWARELARRGFLRSKPRSTLVRTGSGLYDLAPRTFPGSRCSTDPCR